MATFLAILKAIPGLVTLLLKLKESYDMFKQKQIENHYTQKKKAKSRIAKEIEGATTDEQRKELARRLSNLINS